MTTTRRTAAAPRPYHHGHLKQALCEAGIELAREGGPAAIGIREAARRIGVSANASYRHFADLGELVQAVAQEALRGLGQSMQAEIAGRRHDADPAEDAVLLLHSVGRGYVRYALTEPGLFRAAFLSSRKRTAGNPGLGEPPAGSPYRLLQDALQAMSNAGLIQPESLDAAATNAWAAIHGLSELLLGPMAGMPAQRTKQLTESAVRFISQGVIGKTS